MKDYGPVKGTESSKTSSAVALASTWLGNRALVLRAPRDVAGTLKGPHDAKMTQTSSTVGRWRGNVKQGEFTLLRTS